MTELGELERLIGRASNRLRWAMTISGLPCLLCAIGVWSDSTVWSSGLGWRIGGSAGIVFFLGTGAALLWGALRRQDQHARRLHQIMLRSPRQIRSVTLIVARAAPTARWTPDDGSARRGLHISVTDDAGAYWLLPVSRDESSTMMAEFARRCPSAVIEP